MGWLSGGFGPYRMGLPGMMFMKGHKGDFTIEIEDEDGEEDSED